MNIVKIIIITIFLLSNTIPSSAQSFFKGGIVAGFNGSQIDGDQVAGYHKFGLSAGLKVEFPLSSVLDMDIEFLFSQRGSRSSIIPGQFEDLQRIHLNYAELPIIIKWNDWWIESEAYYKVNIQAGFSAARLISSNSNLSPNAISGEFNNYDFSALVGVGFAFTKKWGIGLRFTRSLNTLYKQETNNQAKIKALLGYFITLRTEYTF